MTGEQWQHVLTVWAMMVGLVGVLWAVAWGIREDKS